MMRRQPRVVIVGAGMSGLCQAILLRRAGFTDVTILEKASALGGTWRDNRYPGLTCDVPSHLYQYSFDRNPSWTRMFSPGAEIRAYFERVARRHDVERLIRFGTEVVDACHTGALWQLTTADGHRIEADFLVLATGVLHHPKVSEFAGIEDFTGEVAHSAGWTGDVDIAGRRVAVIGSGSTGVQIMGAVAGVAAHATLFQRSPQWVARVPNPSIPNGLRAALRRIPLLARCVSFAEYKLFEVFNGATTRDGWQRRLVTRWCHDNLATVRDPALREKLTPDYEPMCKRLIIHPSFYRQVERDDVNVETAAIDRFDADGIRTTDGILHPVDVVLMATGFDAHAYMRPMTVRTNDGTTLDDVWADGARAFKSVAVESLPNLFMLLGPHSPIGNFSLVQIAEAQATYVINWIRRWAGGDFDTMRPTSDAIAAHRDLIRRGLPGTVWVTGCQSWYLGADGLPELWPYSPGDYLRLLREPDDARYALESSDSQERTPWRVAH